jgi:hypothetical protein
MDSSDLNEPFIEVSFVSIIGQAKIKTYDVEFDLSLEDFYIIHQQFETKDDKKFYLFGGQHKDKLLNISGLLTSAENPLFSSPPYNSVENKYRISLSKSILNLQLEAFSSVVIFKNNLLNKLSRQSDQTKTEQVKSNPGDLQKKNHSFEVEFNLEEFHILIGNVYSQLLFMKLKGIQGNLCRTRVKTLAHLIVNDFLVIDPSNTSRFHSIICKENNENNLISIDLSLFNYSRKSLEQNNSHINGQIEKINIFFLYKHIQLIQNIISALNTNQSKPKTDSSNQPSLITSFLQQQSSKLRCQINLNGPRVFIPKHSYSDQAILIDLGKLTIETDFIDDQTRSIVEGHTISFENLSANRVKLNNNNEIIENVSLLDCSTLKTLINRRLNIQNIQPDQSKISIKIEWDKIDFIISKDDYLFCTEIYKENFNEKIYHKIPEVQNEPSTNPPAKKQPPVKQDNIYRLLTINLQIKQISLTLYQDQTNINSKLFCFALQFIELDFQQSSNSSYEGKAQIQNLFADYLGQPDNQNSIKRIIEKNSNLKQNTPICIVNLQFKPTDDKNSTSLRQGLFLILPYLIFSSYRF